TDENTLNGGFYVDDIRPVCLFGTVNTISNSIADTTYTFTNHANGEFYYYVRGYNTRGWGEYSCLQKASVGVGISEEDKLMTKEDIGMVFTPTMFRDKVNFYVDGRIEPGMQISIQIYDASGKLVREWNREDIRHLGQLVWFGDDNNGVRLPAGVYFIRMQNGEEVKNGKVVKLR
ncbi:MAG: T9SS type A sorting domain-containing protein, partial [bacterium]